MQKVFPGSLSRTEVRGLSAESGCLVLGLGMGKGKELNEKILCRISEF